MVWSNSIHILALSETHLDSTFSDAEVKVDGYRLFRRDRNKHGGGIAFYVREDIPVKERNDLRWQNIEALWIVHLQHAKPILVGCVYRPPSAKIQYLDEICDMFDAVCDQKREIFILGDLNIDWLSPHCPMKNKLKSTATACGLKQIITQPTRVATSALGNSATCIDHIFTNNFNQCSKAVSVPTGCSDHNIIGVTRKTKLPKCGSKIIHKRTYRYFNQEEYVNEIQSADWSEVYNECNPDSALNRFMNMLMKIIDKHAPLRKRTVRNRCAPWLDSNLKELMVSRDNAKIKAHISGDYIDKEEYRILRNNVVKLDKKKRRRNTSRTKSVKQKTIVENYGAH